MPALGNKRKQQKSWLGGLVLICLSTCVIMMLANYALMMSAVSIITNKNEQGILLNRLFKPQEEVLISSHYHLNLYQTFLRTSSPNDFQLSIITSFDDECYKNYLEENVKSIGRVWNKWINSKPVISKWQVKKCGPSYVDCDRSRWENDDRFIQ